MQIERDIQIDAPAERVWSLITEAEHIGRWFADSGAEIDLRPGGAMTMTWQKHGTVRAVVERVEPPHLFAYRWARPMGAVPAEGNSTLVEFILAAEGGRTRLRVVESGFRGLSIPEQEQTEYAEGNVRGWKSELDEMLAYVARVAA